MRLATSDAWNEYSQLIETPLTTREREVMECLVTTGSREAAAAALDIAEATVAAHLRKIYKKLNVHNGTDAIREMRRRQRAS